MAKAVLRSVLRRLAPARGGAPDQLLLERFLACRDEAAFAALVERHGAMVLAVAGDVLHHRQDAEDVCQATFLVLARRAVSVRKLGSVGSFLHGVAYRLALKARAAAAARRCREGHAPVRGPVDHPDELTWRELSAILHEELARLPDKLRAPLVLCYLEGLTQDQAAGHLRLPKGTLRRRLERARLLLRGRLTRRGLAPGVVLMADTARPAGAALPAAVVSTTARAAAAFAAGRPAGVSAEVTQLTEGWLKAMFQTKLKYAALCLLGACLVTAAAGVFAARAAPEEPPTPPLPPRAAADPGAKPGENVSRPLHTLSGHADRVVSAAYSPDGLWIATASWDGTARLWDARTGKEVRRLDVPATRDYNPSHPSRALFSPDGELVVVGQPAVRDEPAVIVWERRTGKKLRELPAAGPGSVAVSPDGRLIACGGYGFIRLHELANGKLVRELRGQQTRIDSLTFSPDGKTLVTTGPLPRPASPDGRERLGLVPPILRVWDVATGKERRSALDGLSWGPQGLALSPDGRTLALPGTSLLETATGGGRALLAGHTNDVCAAAFSPDGRTLASGSMDGTVCLWGLPSGKAVGRLGKEVPRFAGRGWVLSVAFSPDGRMLVAGGLDKTAEIWDVSRFTGRPRAVAERTPAGLEADWRDLAGDALTGYAALGRLVASPRNAVPFLGKRLGSTARLDTRQAERLIAELDDERYEVRAKATKELEGMGDSAAPVLRKALAGGRSAEARRRLQALLGRLDGIPPPAQRMQQLRAVEALESIGSAEARRWLEKLAAGPDGMRLTQEAKASLGRLARRPTAELGG